jgi:hypothetical protein
MKGYHAVRNAITALGRNPMRAMLTALIDQITLLLRERNGIRPGEADDFRIRDMTEMTEALTSTTTLMTNLLLSVAMISLVVGRDFAGGHCRRRNCLSQRGDHLRFLPGLEGVTVGPYRRLALRMRKIGWT